MSCHKNISRGCCFSRSADSKPSVTSAPGCQKMEIHDWIIDTPNPLQTNDIFEIQFKNTRKGFFRNNNAMTLKKGDVVVVESTPGTDIGIITMGSDLVKRQMRRTGFSPEGCEFKNILRTPNTADIERWQEAIALEHTTMIKARQISASIGLDMKIGDVEYQADKMKAIFYYIADGRVDFRELIKVFAEQFRVRIEMKQIGARQEAGRIGGIAACGRELCCSTWQNNFSSVSINAARVQDITPNPQKLAGQCGKLKCCLNYEMDTYIDARNKMPRINQPIETVEANYFLVKTDPLRELMYFSSDPKNPAIQIPLTVDKVNQILAGNRRGQKINNLLQYTAQQVAAEEPAFENVVGQDSVTRFDKSKKNNNQRRTNNRNNRPNDNKGNDNRGENRNENRTDNRDNRGENRNENRGENRNAPAPQVAKAADGQSAKTEEGAGGNNRRPNNNRRRNGNRNKPRNNGEGNNGGSNSNSANNDSNN